MEIFILPNYTNTTPAKSIKNLDIYVDQENQWLYTNWTGTPSVETVKEGLEAILTFLKMPGINKILNDNRQLKGTWTGAIDWITNDWSPRALATGYRATAMIYSPDVFGKFSVDTFLKQNESSPIQQMPFHSFKEAAEWLKEQ